MNASELIDKIDWQKMDGLVPAVVQHSKTHRVLMVGYMNRDAFTRTVESGLVTFFSRSRQKLWTKGETSKNTLTLVAMETDCDQDALIIHAYPAGPTCHLNTESCFDSAKVVVRDDMYAHQHDLAFLMNLQHVIEQRKDASSESSYTAQLFGKGIKRIAQKVGEEGVEVALAAVDGDQKSGEVANNELLNESADLLFHLMVLLSAKDTSLQQVVGLLESRHSG